MSLIPRKADSAPAKREQASSRTFGSLDRLPSFFPLAGDFDQIVRQLFSNGPFGGPFGEMGRLWSRGSASPDTGLFPRLDVSETEDSYRIGAEVPGVDPADLAVELHDNVLTISGEKREEAREGDESTFCSERSYGTFRRSIRLPLPVDADNVSAEHANGIVTIRLQKLEVARPKRIQVRTPDKN